MNLYEILVPCQTNDGKPIRTRQHREWGRRIRRIVGGLTILSPTKGQWVSQEDKLFCDRMIPVRIAASADEMEKIADITAAFYNQRAVMFYELSTKVTIKHYENDQEH